MIIISVILKKSKILSHHSNAQDVVNYGQIVLRVIVMKKHVLIFASMNLLVDIARKQNLFSKTYPRNIKIESFLTTILHMISKVF
jgi:hypothetical protein